MERIIKIDSKDSYYLIAWKMSLDNKVWARCYHIKNGKTFAEFGKFKTKKQAKEYIEKYLIDNGEILPF